MSGAVSGNPEPARISDFAILLRAVATTIPATGLLYLAADMLTDGGNDQKRAHNKAVLDMTALLLGFQTDQPELVERVLRSLPDPT